jgi:hypothetical protein
MCAADAAGEHSLPERPPDEDAHPVTLRDRQHLAFDAAAEDRIGRLIRAEPFQAAPLGDPLGFDDVGRGHRGRADRADFPAVDQVRERGKRFLDVGGRVRPVDLIEVDPVGLQAAQRVLDRGHDPAPRGSLVVGIVACRAAELGREDNAAAAPLERFAHGHLGLAVCVGSIDEVDPRVQRLVDDAGRVIVVGVADGRAESQSAQRVGADLDTGPPEGPVLHADS